ncbi:hypothetical protein [Sphingomonas parva]|uniref:hypothetical protein n=1 Tax=Sphingomonas parva TaxID=2555898 RepID=UPI001CDD0FC4|nr:hypothetical protein [Sphingomonas parva]
MAEADAAAHQLAAGIGPAACLASHHRGDRGGIGDTGAETDFTGDAAHQAAAFSKAFWIILPGRNVARIVGPTGLGPKRSTALMQVGSFASHEPAAPHDGDPAPRVQPKDRFLSIESKALFARSKCMIRKH